jgi:hypothetical protein
MYTRVFRFSRSCDRLHARSPTYVQANFYVNDPRSEETYVPFRTRRLSILGSSALLEPNSLQTLCLRPPRRAILAFLAPPLATGLHPFPPRATRSRHSASQLRTYAHCCNFVYFSMFHNLFLQNDFQNSPFPNWLRCFAFRFPVRPWSPAVLAGRRHGFWTDFSSDRYCPPATPARAANLLFGGHGALQSA